MGGKFFTILGIFVFLALATSVNAFSASTDKIIYVSNETVQITGNTTNGTDVNATFYNSLDSSIGTSSTTSSADGSFDISFYLNDTPTGDYYTIVTSGSDSVQINFKVVSELIYLEPHLMKTSEIISVNTSTGITSGANYTDLINLSKSTPKKIHYGSKVVGPKTYHFAIVDQNYQGAYDTVYIDDDNLFQLYNDTEDLSGPGQSEIEQQSLRNGYKIKGANFQDFIIGETDLSGNRLILAKPVNTSAYSSGDTVYFIVLAKDSNKNLLANQHVTIDLLNSAGVSQGSRSGVTNEFGYYNHSFTAPSTIGLYTISVNDSTGVEFFSVESFRLKGKITDLSGNPTYSFAPNPKVRINAISKNLDGDMINLASIEAQVTYPNGTTVDVTFIQSSTGTYYQDLDLNGAPNGEYGVKITGVYGGDTQIAYTGFSIEAVSFALMAMNVEFMDQAEGSESMVNAFAPNTNITIMALLSNVSGGGLFSKGPEGMGLIEIDDPSTLGDDCPDRISIIEIRDDGDVLYYNNTDYNYSIMNLSNVMNYFGFGESPGEGPPPEMLSQCMIVITSGLGKEGEYKIMARIDHPLGEKTSGANFGVQRLYASGSTVDFKGEDFKFFAPNSTVRIKLKIKDLTTREEVNASSIINAKIIEMYKEFPEFKDVFTNISNENVTEGVLSFTSPNEEGFFSMKFRFRANVSNTIYEGIGNAFFMLKKYIIWGYAECDQQGGCYSSVGQNITLAVTAVDIDQGSMFGMGMTTSMTCTGCDGLGAEVQNLRNDQIGKEYEEGVDYTVQKGALINGTTTVKIIPSGSGLPTGWYGVDIVLKDSITNSTYFGWGGFEIRNFWVETIPITDEGGQLIMMWQEPSYAKNSPILFGILARDPQNPENPLPITEDPEVQGVRWMNSYPPLDVPFTANVSQRNVTLVACQGEGCPPPQNLTNIWVVNITGLDKEGYHQANVEVTTGKGSDIGSFWFDISSYKVRTTYRGMEDWPAMFSSDENLSVTFIATEFDENTPHSLSNTTPPSCAKLFGIYDQKKGEPVRINSSKVYVYLLSDNVCRINISLEDLPSGRYFADFEVNDSNGMKKSTGMEFVIRSFTVNIPSLEEAWIQYSDTPTNEININNDRDSCDNERGLGGDYYSEQNAEKWLNDENSWGIPLNPDECPEEANKICTEGLNFTVDQNYTGYDYASWGCVLDNGSVTGDIGVCDTQPGAKIYIVANTTHLWFNTSNVTTDVINMSGITPNVTGDKLYTGNRNWTIASVYNEDGGNKWFEVYDDNTIHLCWGSQCDPSIDLIVSSRNYTKSVANPFCILNGAWNDSNNGFCSGSGDQVYVFSNTTHVWINNDTDLTGVTPVRKGIINLNGIEWYVIDVGRQNDGSLNDNVFRIAPGYTSTIVSVNDGQLNITVTEKYTFNKGQKFCINERGEWNDMSDCENETEVYVYSNSTHIWINSSADLSSSTPFTNDGTPILNSSVPGGLADKDWALVSIGGNQYDSLRIRHAYGKICGEAQGMCGFGGCERIYYTMVPPLTHQQNATFYHGRVNLISDQNIGNNLGLGFNETRYVYIYHNTTHFFMDLDTNLTNAQYNTTNRTIQDPYGGKWTINYISNQIVKLYGSNVVASTGLYINTSLSKSGIINIGRMEEQWFGKWGKSGKSGLDLDGDALTNGTLYFAISDQAAPGVYDTFFFIINNSVINKTIPLSGTIAERTFGKNDTLILLSIDPRANRVKLYSKQTGDWGDLGDFKIGNNVTIPVIVRTPGGSPTDANVSIENVKLRTTEGYWLWMQLSPAVTESVTDLGEVKVNLSSYGYTGAGEYMFEIFATKDGNIERLEEWKWPRARMRSYLMDTYRGDAGFIRGFVPLPLTRYDWSVYGEIDRIRIDNRNSSVPVTGMFIEAHQYDWQSYGCTLNDANATCSPDSSNCVMLKRDDDGQDVFFMYKINASKLYKNDTTCNFTDSTLGTEYTEGDSIIFTRKGKNYNLTILKIDQSDFSGGCSPQGCWRADFGMPGIDPAIILPMRNDTDHNPDWGVEWGYMHNVSIDGVIYDIILANDTVDYPMCSIWNMQECVKKAWFTTNRNFSSATPVLIGKNFTSDLYLARIGPGPWEGITAGNFSQTGEYMPGVDVRINDGTTSYFKAASESQIGLDLNMNNAKNDLFYIVTFDDKQDGLSSLTSNIVDDDLNMTEDWWRDDTSEEYMDFYSTESGSMSEKRRGLPNAMWSGNMLFGEMNESENFPWEMQPEWKIVTYNDTDMFIIKDKWRVNETDNVTVIVRVFDFNQNPISNANVSVEKVIQMSHMGGFPANYTVDTTNSITNSDGYAFVKIIPASGSWQTGSEYMIRLNVNSTGKIETTEEWFRIGGWW